MSYRDQTFEEMKPFDKALHLVTGMEGDYSNHHADPGGKTKFGITEEVARDYGYEGKMKDLTKETQRKIAKSKYWNPWGDPIADVSIPLAVEIFEIGFNVGTRRAMKWFQEWLNDFSRMEMDYDKIPVDGVWGPKTMGAFMGYSRNRDTFNLVRAMNATQLTYYQTLVHQNEDKFSHFLYGWIDKRGDLSIYDEIK